MTYSTRNHINGVIRSLGAAPLAIADMDGCILIGYNTGSPEPLPAGLSPDTLEQGVLAGQFHRAIFAAYAMDVRLTPAMAAFLNTTPATPAPLAFLTSRPMDAALTILRNSGVTPQAIANTIIVADSGANIAFNGTISSIRQLDAAEQVFFDYFDENVLRQSRAAIADVLRAQEIHPDLAQLADFEKKGIARNIHHRKILETRAQPEGSALDLALKDAVAGVMQAFVTDHAADAKKYKVHFGPATVETILTGTDKASGLTAIIDTYRAVTGRDPTGIMGAGDDLHGTDQPFARKLATLDLATAFIHVHHALPDDPLMPDPQKAIDTIPGVPLRIAASVPTPWMMADIILETVAPQRHAKRLFTL